MKSLHILISAGPTIEFIDPVRFLSNRSSGKMGYALAQAAQKLGHQVTLVTGPTALKPPKGCQVIPVTTAQEMDKALTRLFPRAQVMLMAAAVADYRPVQMARHKIKKAQNELSLKLVRNPDILKKLGKQKKAKQMLVGFAAETENFLKNAQKKLAAKNLDWIFLNDVSRSDIGFDAENNEAIAIGKNGVEIKFPKQRKTKLAQKMLGLVVPKSQSRL